MTITIAKKCIKIVTVKSKRLLYFADSFITNYITIDNYYYLPLLCEPYIKRKKGVDELTIEK